MTNSDAAYLAALIDCNGYIGLGKSGHNGYVPHVIIYHKNKEVIKWCQKVTNIGSINLESIKNQSYDWHLHNDEIIPIFEMTKEHIKFKNKHIELITQYLNECRGRQGIPANIKIKKLRDKIYTKMSKLNAKIESKNDCN